MHLKNPEEVLIEETMSNTPKKTKRESTTRTWIAEPVIAPEFTEEPTCTKFYVGILKEKKTISKVIPTISAIFPGFNHLKRCSNQKILLCPVQKESSEREETQDCNLSPDDLKTLLRDKGFDLSLLADNLEIISVAAKPPKTKVQANLASKTWPVNFHPDIRLEAIISGKEFNDNQLESIEKCMQITIEAAKREAIGSKSCTGSALIVDPEGKILALAASKLDLHPMWHAAMLAIDLVASLQGGGAWKLTQENVKGRIKEIHSSIRAGDYNPAGKRLLEAVAPLCYPASLSDIAFPEIEPFIQIKESKAQRKSKTTAEIMNNKESKSKEGPYLCTGYWVFLLQEPCALCAMALLHSRVSKIFCGRKNLYSGVLGSRALLHLLPGLNHRYQVWRGILELQCSQVSDKKL
ncbi:probable inactive tRNA-specific adenosine deaminase-like protein 3 [Belonocnema kinseyi]|uniref:probable inactive tRNA-specific adenosine deaminase-like protein 3 n=1 Tax=Belonocnema kinseyi TaxID=2817044 RepID=UPI00143DFF57|nr:probable inactive tRNA-specific adenosine deaminase-like protein 3 [Belonocnema kinseyi]XP_033220202.1 probable inactive tRNA-specific adenosine deaminase-like protein 3 [Belonocnema kinseyi]